ncbi:MAG: phenylalanine--tRNA ligase subunit beta [Candidatus Saccharimonadales bacterium]
MKISLNWIKQFTEVSADIDQLVEKIGAQLGAVEEVEDLGVKYKGAVVVKVVSCVDHPGADRLHVCTIDDGGITKDVKRDENGYVQVVCGAPNVREGMLVVWLPPGSTVPESVGKDPFVLEARELRGVVSNGMLASPKELALGDNHEGILEIEEAAAPGTPFADVYELNDAIIDIENKMFTHRPDCFGQLGVAREIAGIFGKPFTSPDWYKTAGNLEAGSGLPLVVRNELPELVPRFMAVAIKDVAIKPSPMWLQSLLMRVGVRPISNVVDITNYIMLLTGQPLHAYDYDKVKALDGSDTATLVARYPKQGEKVTLLNGKEIELRPEAIMIATESQLIGVGGVMGGAETEVDDNTKNIILECANFDMYSIRRTSMAQGLFTDAVTRFNKGQSPLQNPQVLAKAVQELQAVAGGTVASEWIDDNHIDGRQWVHPPVPVSTGFINDRLGFKLPANDMKSLLENVEFQVAVEGEDLTVSAPFWRTDVETREDVVEEVGRLYGFDHLPLELPKRSINPATRDGLLEAKANIRAKLAKAGANEVLTYSFVHGNLLEKTGQDAGKAFSLTNALSPDLQYYRMSLLPSLLDKVHPNIKAGYDQFALFEIGKTHGLDNGNDDDGLPREFEFTALVVAASDKLRMAGAAYYQARKYLESLVWQGALEFKPISKDMEQYAVVQPYDLQRSAIVSLKGGEFLGIIGEFKPGVTRALKLPAYCAGFEVDTTVLQSLLAAGPSYNPLSRFPSVKQDITLKLPAELSYQEAYDFVDTEVGAKAIDDTHVRLEPVAVYQSQDDKLHKHVTFRLTTFSYNRTLTDVEVAKLLDAVAETAKSKLGAERV